MQQQFLLAATRILYKVNMGKQMTQSRSKSTIRRSPSPSKITLDRVKIVRTSRQGVSHIFFFSSLFTAEAPTLKTQVDVILTQATQPRHYFVNNVSPNDKNQWLIVSLIESARIRVPIPKQWRLIATRVSLGEGRARLSFSAQRRE